MMDASGITSGFAFSRNPIILRNNWSPLYFDINGGEFYIDMEGAKIYKGRFFPPLEIDISEIFDAYAMPFREPHNGDTDVIKEIEDDAELYSRKAFCYFDYNGNSVEYEFTVIPGGISKHDFRYFSNHGKDVFGSRFLNRECNFFLTTRTAGNTLVIKETELFPLYFIANRYIGQIDVTENVNNSVLSFKNIPVGIHALDINALRRQFMDEHMVIPNVFDIAVSGKHSCRIIVARSEPARSRYRIKFRNSLGVFEILEINGDVTATPEYSSTDNMVFDHYDQTTGAFSKERDRMEYMHSISVEMMVNRSKDVHFMLDMLGSDEVYLLDLTDQPLKVIPMVEDINCKTRQESPEKIKLKFDVCETDINISKFVNSDNIG